MMRRIIAATLLLIGAILAWLWLFPSEESRIKQRIDDLAGDANQAGSDVAGLASAARVATYFTEDVRIEPREGQPVQGRQIILSIAAQLKNAATTTEVTVDDVDVNLSRERTSADVRLTATIRRNEDSPEATQETYPFALSMKKVDGEWLISHVRSPDTVR